VIEITSGDTASSAASPPKTSRLRYVRLTDTGACEAWPNPCKKGS
jgi:hypothetical protein